MFFPSPNDPNKPISKAVNLWFSNLCKKVLGHSSNNYILRHSKGSALQKKVREGTLSKDNAVEFMRHSEKMFDKVYSHMDKEDIKALMKKQIYNTKKLTADVRHQLEIKIAEQDKKIAGIIKQNKNIKEQNEEMKEYLEEVARNQLGWQIPGEEVVVVTKDGQKNIEEERNKEAERKKLLARD